jgi:hypothetical protein
MRDILQLACVTDVSSLELHFAAGRGVNPQLFYRLNLGTLWEIIGTLVSKHPFLNSALRHNTYFYFVR